MRPSRSALRRLWQERNAESWLSIAAALARKFGDTLHEPMDPGATGRFAALVPASPLDAPEGLTEEGGCDDLGINVAEDN